MPRYFPTAMASFAPLNGRTGFSFHAERNFGFFASLLSKSIESSGSGSSGYWQVAMLP